MPLLLVHLAATWYLVGLIWTIQLVHYKLFDGIGEAGWAEYHQRHVSGITPVVGPVMLVELVTAVWLVVRTPAGVPGWTAWVGLALVVALWVSTAFWQVPMHNRLAAGFNVELAQSLTRSNWLRTVVWTVRGLLAVWMVWATWQAAVAASLR